MLPAAFSRLRRLDSSTTVHPRLLLLMFIDGQSVLNIVADPAIRGSFVCFSSDYISAHIDICFSPETICFGTRVMPSLTGCSAIQMYLVAEVHERGKLVYPDPRDG